MSDLDPVPHVEEVTAQGLSEEEVQQISNRALEYVRSQPHESTIFGNAPYDPVVEMMIELDKVPEDIGKRFDSHGIAKGFTRDQVSGLNQFLTRGVDSTRQFHSVPLKGARDAATALGAAGPLLGAFIILGNVNRPITEGIGYVITNSPFAQSIPLLSSRFPQVEFIPVSKAAQRLGEIVAK